jgi:hypothetical protein
MEWHRLGAGRGVFDCEVNEAFIEIKKIRSRDQFREKNDSYLLWGW